MNSADNLLLVVRRYPLGIVPCGSRTLFLLPHPVVLLLDTNESSNTFTLIERKQENFSPYSTIHSNL